MPIIHALHHPRTTPKQLDELVGLAKSHGAILLRTPDHDLSDSDFIGYRTPTFDLGGLDVVIVFALEAYPERVERRDELAKQLAESIMTDAVWGELRVRVQLQLGPIGWSYI